jgi:predicted transcriptional regulator
MEMRDKDQADFDLEKMFEMLDQALTSKDERVQNALRGLLTIVALTRPQDDGSMAADTNHGPLRRMQEDLKDINRRLWNMQSEFDQIKYQRNNPWNVPATGQPYTNPGSPYQPPATYPYINPGQNPDPGYWTTTGTNPTLWSQK